MPGLLQEACWQLDVEEKGGERGTLESVSRADRRAVQADRCCRARQLRVFKAKYGHCNVPQQIKMNGKGRVGTCSLGTWVTM